MNKKIIFIASLFLSIGLLSAKGTGSMPTGDDVSFEPRWLPGYMINLKGEKIEGEVKSGITSGEAKVVKSVRFRKNKDDKTKFFKAKDLQEIAQGASVIYSVKIKKKRRYYRALYKGKNIAIYKDPTAETFISQGVTRPKNHLAWKPGYTKLKKVSATFFKKNMRKICGDKPEFIKHAEANKKWLKYRNVVEVAKFYDTL